jgi:hypothetical protein
MDVYDALNKAEEEWHQAEEHQRDNYNVIMTLYQSTMSLMIGYEPNNEKCCRLHTNACEIQNQCIAAWRADKSRTNKAYLKWVNLKPYVSDQMKERLNKLYS